MDLRNATLNDLQGVYNLICELEEKEMPYEEFRNIYSQNVKCKNVHYLVVEDEQQVIGFGSIHIQSLLHHSERVAEIQELIVRDCYRGRSIGSKLVDRMIEISEDEKCEIIEVCCNRKRVDSHEFYESCGFNKSHYKFTLQWTGKRKYQAVSGRRIHSSEEY